MAKIPDNPFLLQGYAGRDYFCDRKEELRALKDAMRNQRNVNIVSHRRMGKTALIWHLFKSQRSFKPVFVDLYRTRNQGDMVMRIIEETVKQVGKPTSSLLKTASKVIRSVELQLSFDSITGLPEISAGLKAGKKEAVALAELFQFLEGHDKQVVLAIDEFQQIVDYPEDNTEALLREHVQKLSNVNFIFSGSNRRMMHAIFSDNARPFYQATEPMYLGPIASDDYVKFIQAHFDAGGMTIAAEVVHDGLAWCRRHTYYVQYLFNRLYSLGRKNYKDLELFATKYSILKERAPEYITLLNLLSPNQSSLLEAIARDEVVKTPTSIEFIMRHRLSAVSTVRQSLAVLVDKQLVHLDEDGYRVTDVFLSRWCAESH